MGAQQRIVRVRRSYNQWVANETLEDYALRFTAKRARRWSNFRVANTAIGAISFLALEAIGGAITVNYGFTNAAAAILLVGAVIFLTSVPIAYYACKYGVDIDLLTRGAGFGYIGSTITSLIYASFTFIFFAIEAAIMSLALELCFGVPLFIGYVVSSLIVIPLVTHGITFISRFQLWTQPLWIGLHILPFAFIAFSDPQSFSDWTRYEGASGTSGGRGFDLILFGTASTVVFSLVAQIGEQVDFLRFLPPRQERKRAGWWFAYLLAGPGWIVPGVLKMLAGSFLAFLAIRHLVPLDKAVEPTQMYLVAFEYVSSPPVALALTGVFVILSQLKINVTNAYAGSIAWSNFFSRLTHSHPGRVVWLVFNVTIGLLLMELGIFKVLEHTLGLYSIVAVAWVGALVADLVINKPLGLSPPGIEFKRAHLFDINPVGVGSMVLSAAAGIAAFSGLFGPVSQALSAFIALLVAFASAPLIAWATRGRYYIARKPLQPWPQQDAIACAICEHHFEPEDMAHCPAYSGPICSLCCSLETRCRDLCKPHGRLAAQAADTVGRRIPAPLMRLMKTDVGHYLGVMGLFTGIIGLVLVFVYFQVSFDGLVNKAVLQSTLWTVFFILAIIAGVAAWLFVLAHDSRRVAEEESRRQTDLLMREIEAHQRTDAKLQKAKEVAEAASQAKSRHVVGLSHELRTPLNAILGYAQILERDPAMPARRAGAVKVVRRSAEHLSGLIDGLLDISKIEAGRFRLNRNEVPTREFLDQLVEMFRLQAQAKGIEFHFVSSERLPAAVFTDESRLRQILINLLSNAIKFTDRGHVTLRVSYHFQVAEFEVEDTGIGIHADDLERIFQPFERAGSAASRATVGTGLGLTITKLLTETMGGEVIVRSTLGKGSLFRVKLMLSAVAHPRTVSKIDAQVRGYAGPPQTILVVDDDEVQRDLVRELLLPLGFEVGTAASGEACLALAEAMRPNLILLDVSMPGGMDGWEAARRVRALPGPRPAIVMLSALAVDKDREVEPAPMHDGYLMKPIDLQQLLDKIHALLAVEWTYEGTAERPQLLPVAALASIPLPSEADIDELMRLADIGYVRGIEAKLTEIVSQTPQCEPLITRLRVLTDGFDLKNFNATLAALRRSHV